MRRNRKVKPSKKLLVTDPILCFEKLRVEETSSGDRRYVAKQAIKAGTFIAKSNNGFIIPCDQITRFMQNSMNYLQKIPDQFYKKTTILYLFMKNITESSFQPEEILKELFPRNLNQVEESVLLEAKGLTESYIVSGLETFGFSAAEICLIHLKLISNLQQIVTEYFEETGDQGLFPSTAFFNHSCWPNCTAFFTKEGAFFFLI